MEYADRNDYLATKILEVSIQVLNLQKHTPINNEDKLRLWSLNAIEALYHVHAQGIIHCDIKPENILLSTIGLDKEDLPIAKLCDFGLCHIIDP